MLRLKLNLLASLLCWVRLNELEIVAVWIIVALVADENSLDCGNDNVQFIFKFDGCFGQMMNVSEVSYEPNMYCYTNDLSNTKL